VVKNQKGATGGGDEKKEQPVAGTCEGLVGGNEQSTNTFDSDYRIAVLKNIPSDSRFIESTERSILV
jgi:hypothetical protein